MCDVVVLKGSEQKSYLQLFKFCTFVTPTPSVLSHISTSCAGECGLSVLAALNTMFPARALKGSGWVAAIFSTHIASLPCSDLNDSSVWEWKKGFVSPLDELPITTGPTAVVTHCVSMCQGVCVLCAHTVMKLHRVSVRIVVKLRRLSVLCCFQQATHQSVMCSYYTHNVKAGGTFKQTYTHTKWNYLEFKVTCPHTEEMLYCKRFVCTCRTLSPWLYMTLALAFWNTHKV